MMSLGDAVGVFIRSMRKSNFTPNSTPYPRRTWKRSIITAHKQRFQNILNFEEMQLITHARGLYMEFGTSTGPQGHCGVTPCIQRLIFIFAPSTIFILHPQIWSNFQITPSILFYINLHPQFYFISICILNFILFWVGLRRLFRITPYLLRSKTNIIIWG